MTAALRFRNLTLGYDRHPAVHHLDGAVESGALVAVVGPNGAGKSTLFKGIVGVIKPLAGRIERGDANPQDIAYLPQAAEIDRTFPINVYDMVSMGLWRRAGSFGGIDRAARTSIEQAIAAVGLSGFENRAIATLSGGQMQRMLFARLLLQDARVIVLDEPFNAVDAKTSADLFDLVRRRRRAAHRAHRHARHRFRARFPETLPGAVVEPVAGGGLPNVLTPKPPAAPGEAPTTRRSSGRCPLWRRGELAMPVIHQPRRCANADRGGWAMAQPAEKRGKIRATPTRSHQPLPVRIQRRARRRAGAGARRLPDRRVSDAAPLCRA
jgi:zinc/manganese transport system ATP-binding protein